MAGTFREFALGGMTVEPVGAKPPDINRIMEAANGIINPLFAPPGMK